MAVSVKISFKAGKLDLSRVSPDQIQKVGVRAINKGIKKVKTDAIREITDLYNVKSALIRPMLQAQKTNKAELTGRLMASRFTIPIKNFDPVANTASGKGVKWYGKKAGFQFTKEKPQRKQGVSVEIKKGQRLTINSAFISVTRSGQFGVRAYGAYGTNFQFSDDASAKTSRLMTVSPLSALLNKDVAKRLSNKASEYYEKEYIRLITDITKGVKY